MQNAEMKTKLFGYSKKDTMAYIDSLISEYEAKIADYNNRLQKQKKENETLIAENKEIFLRIEQLEEERQFVSQAVISAQKRAQAVIEEAEEEAKRIIAQTNADLEDTRRETETLREQIKTLKIKAVAAIRKYESQLDEI